ncbi:hypothetical protein [Methylobacterium sp. WL93]|uniref:hypothetical protein n=1 Tax=Methylobacterium sp. WL93 TaxID=2603892 RepID=UPI0016504A96|nr:hypothetical protein [Methylobacterium sp. WL93]
MEASVAALVGRSVAEAEGLAIDFEAYASIAPNPLRERVALILAEEIRTASDQREHRRASMQRFRL